MSARRARAPDPRADGGPTRVADSAEAIARVHGSSLNQLIIDALRAEMERVRTDGSFRTQARRLLHRDATILETLAPAGKRRKPGQAKFAEQGGSLDYDELITAARRGGPPGADQVTVMSDGRRVDSADDLRAVIGEFTRLRTADAAARMDR